MIKEDVIRRTYTGATLTMLKVSIQKEMENIRKNNDDIASGQFTKKMIQRGFADGNYAITIADLRKVMSM